MEDNHNTQDYEAREKALQDREALLALAQRRLDARDMLRQRQLPDNMIGLLELSGDQQMMDSISQAQTLWQGAQTPPEAPKAGHLSAVQANDYHSRAGLYLADRAAYHNTFGGKL